MKNLLLIVAILISNLIIAQTQVTVQNNTDCGLYYELFYYISPTTCESAHNGTFFIGGNTTVSHTVTNPDEFFVAIEFGGSSSSCIHNSTIGIQDFELENCYDCPAYGVPNRKTLSTCMPCQSVIDVEWNFNSCKDALVTIN